MRLLRLLVVLLGAFAASHAAHAQPPGELDESPSVKLNRWDSEAKRIQERLETPEQLESWNLDQMRAILEAQRAEIPAVVAATESELEPLRRQLEALGPESEAPPTDAAPEVAPPPLPGLTLELPVAPAGEPAQAPAEPPAETPAETAAEAAEGAAESAAETTAETTAEVAAERERLTTRIRELEAQLKLLSQADARATSLLSQISELRRQIFTRQLLTRGPSPLEPGVAAGALVSLHAVATGIFGETAGRVDESRLDLPLALRVSLSSVLALSALVLVVVVRRVLLDRLFRHLHREMPEARRTLIGVGATLVRIAVPVLAVVLMIAAARITGLVGDQGRTLLRGLGWTGLAVTGAYALSGAFYSPYVPGLRLSRLPEGACAAAHRWLMALAAVVGLDRVLVVEGEALGLSIPALSFLNAILIALGACAIWLYVRHLRAGASEVAAAAGERPPHDEEGGGDEEFPAEGDDVAIGPIVNGILHFIARAVALAAPALALAGYFAASRFLFYPVVFSGAVIGLGVLLFHVVQDAVNRFIIPDAAGAEAGAPHRIRLIPVFVGFLLICAGAPVLALIWGADTTDLANAWRAFSTGFEVGEVTVSPPDFFWFLLVFSVGYMLTRMVQAILRRSVMPVSGLDAGGRAAISAGVFYLGLFLSALVAISVAGLDLSSLALVAGALSVGIGFGLQNVVNNFVSGLILLLERPIKAGDWIQITSGMGYVKQIRVRSTEIETFDRQALIVPNSELIQSSVINWTHTSMQGRVIVPVHVAFGTDPARVEKILMEIARGHPTVLRRPAPFVLFRRFGPDALEFEIRAYLRDVNWILNVHSDMNFEIARRFAEEGIHIPYPQRDLHLRNTDEMARSIRDALDAGTAAEPAESDSPEGAESDSPEAAPARPRRRRRLARSGPAPGDAGEGGGGADF